MAVNYTAYPGEWHKSIRYSNLYYAPEEGIRRLCGLLYENHPILARSIWVPLNVVTGVVKPVLFPAAAAIGVLVMPIIAAGCCITGLVTNDSKWYGYGEGWLKAWAWSLLTVGILGTFLMLHTYFFPLMVPVCLLIAAIGASTAIHVYRALQDPPKPSVAAL